MIHRIGIPITTLAIILAAAAASAHHNNTRFDPEKHITLTGTLTKFDYRNPHIEFSVEVKGDQGQAESWIIEGWPPNAFALRKISKADFQKAVGQTVTAEAEPARDGSPRGHLRKITFPDGRST